MKRRHAIGLMTSLGYYMYACGGSQMNSRSAPPEIPMIKNQETPPERQQVRHEDPEEEPIENKTEDRSPPKDYKKKILSSRWKGCCPGASLFGNSKGSASKDKQWTTVAYLKIKSLAFKNSESETNPIRTEKILGGYYHDISHLGFFRF